MVAACSFLKGRRLKYVDHFSGGPIARPIGNDGQRPEGVARRVQRETRNHKAAKDVINRRRLTPSRARETGSIEDPVEIQIIGVTNRSALKGASTRERRFVHATLPVDVRHGTRESNRLANPYKTVGWVGGIGPPVSQLSAPEICARLAGLCISCRPVVDELLATTYLIEVLLWVMVNDKLGILILWTIAPRALH